ncbi:MAG: LptF/LptG family permease [bacterium]|nr:LptF/LptG family permease [Candidatus Sumerlaeota bacterium]
MIRSCPRILIIDRYLFTEFAISFFAVIAFCALLLLVATIFDKFQSMAANSTPVGMAALYFTCDLPGKLIQVVPMASMLAVLFSVGTLARNNETLAMMTSGVPSVRIAAPIVFGGLIIFAATLILNEYCIPQLDERARFLEKRYIDAKAEMKITTESDVFQRGRQNRFYVMRLYSLRDKKMYRPQIYQMNDDFTSVKRRMEAESAEFVSNDPANRKSEWVFRNPRIWDLDEQGRLVSFMKYEGDQTVNLEEDLPDLLAQKKNPEEMNFSELRRHIRILTERRQPAYAFMTDLILKITFPMGILIIMVIGFFCAVRTRQGTVMTIFGYGISWAFAYYGLAAFLRAMGHTGSISPYTAGLVPAAVFIVVAVYYYRHSYRWYS